LRGAIDVSGLVENQVALRVGSVGASSEAVEYSLRPATQSSFCSVRLRFQIENRASAPSVAPHCLLQS
jgi:hypothetical protein